MSNLWIHKVLFFILILKFFIQIIKYYDLKLHYIQ